MQRPIFLAVLDVIPEVTTQLVVCLGRPCNESKVERGMVLVFDNVTDNIVDKISCLDPHTMAGGLIIVTTASEHRLRQFNVLRAQKILAYLFTKYVQLPCLSTRIPDPLGLRPEGLPPEYLHLINRYNNTPFHLQKGLVDKLRDKKIGMPCLLAMPGPSLRELAPKLPELSKRYLIITISRTLPFLRACGVMPDILVQLDTVPLQEHFHHPDDTFSNSILLSLSLAPIRSFAHKFRQLFFIDSFDLSVLPNTTRVRESWLSSLLPCLGCAEVLHAPKVILAGADLRLMGKDSYYNEQGEDYEKTQKPFSKPLEGNNDFVCFSDYQGKYARTTLQYFAVSAEAELFANEIRTVQGSVFNSLSPWSILDPNVYAPLSLDEALEAPKLDKDRFLAMADEAAVYSERVSLRTLRAHYSRHLEEARRNRDIMACLNISAPETIKSHPCYQYVANNVPWFRPNGEDGLRLLAAKLSEQLYIATRFARNIASLHILASSGVAIPVLCTAEEETKTVASLKHLQPSWSWRCIGICAINSSRLTPSAGHLDLKALYDWLHVQDVVIIAPNCSNEFHYVLSLVADDNVIYFDELTAYDHMHL